MKRPRYETCEVIANYLDWYPFISPCADDESGHQVLLKRPIPRKVRACAQNFLDSSFRLKNPRQRSIQRVRRMGNERTRNTQKKSYVARVLLNILVVFYSGANPCYDSLENLY